LERHGDVLIKPFCPPYYRDMEEAVLAFVDYKYAPGRGTFRDGGLSTGWREGAAVQSEIPRYSDEAIAATIEYCKYVYERYGRFPLNGGPFRTLLAYQAHIWIRLFTQHFIKVKQVRASWLPAPGTGQKLRRIKRSKESPEFLSRRSRSLSFNREGRGSVPADFFFLPCVRSARNWYAFGRTIITPSAYPT
jgi:hypothetical protein